MNPLLESIWAGHEKSVVPADAGEDQRFDTRQAFYAGATALFELFTGPMTRISDEAACKVLDGIQAEIRQNVELVKERAYGRPN